MSIDFLISILNTVENPKKVNRNKAANIVLEQPELIEFLVDLTFKTDEKISIKAAWILEWICTHHGINYLIPYIDTFTTNIHSLRFDGVLRTCAKNCEHLAIAFDEKNHNKTKETLTDSHIDAIIETGFDWLISNQKIAVKAYTMNTLFLFGKYKDWVHSELEHIIRTKVIHESKGCEARGKKVLSLIHKRNNS
ncbi:adenylosuccinate lyase [Tenacibaculum jejuense]|uniref:Adenylosuccinate lyase n=1 Tax=Tenacibaculum jejuense TaxID=584609 RepID=A0A238UA97_9FLAO|nr:adenylosuccinate lyase [Tenacibaculum jejuense]SNR15488.1 conserved protein of unknown function [Tenacibaculum jejuense]